MDWRDRARLYWRPRKRVGALIVAAAFARYLALAIERLGDVDFLASNAGTIRDLILDPWFGLAAIVTGFAWLVLVPDEREDAGEHDDAYIQLGNGFSLHAHKGKRDRDSEDRWTIELALTVRNDERRSAQDVELRLVRVDSLCNVPDGLEYKPIERLQPARLGWSQGDGGGATCSFQHEATAIVADLKTWGDSTGAYTQIRPADQSLWDDYRVNESTLHMVVDLTADARVVARFVVEFSTPTRMSPFRGKDEPTVYFGYSDSYTERERTNLS